MRLVETCVDLELPILDIIFVWRFVYRSIRAIGLNWLSKKKSSFKSVSGVLLGEFCTNMWSTQPWEPCIFLCMCATLYRIWGWSGSINHSHWTAYVIAYSCPHDDNHIASILCYSNLYVSLCSLLSTVPVVANRCVSFRCTCLFYIYNHVSWIYPLRYCLVVSIVFPLAINSHYESPGKLLSVSCAVTHSQ